ncbi:MAG: hypothetical protein HKO89_04195, partial [Saprospiraceae bacterium]|nr:hypothetical protein [Saprospiraceae bacterium]
MIKNIFCIVFLLGLISCKPSPEKSGTVTQETVSQTSNQSQQGFKSIPQELVMDVWNNADLLDYIFHDLPFSMSQDQQASIRSNVSYIAREAQTVIPSGCKPMARQFFAKQGNIFLEADIYFDENCRFYVFYVDGKAA